MIAAILLAACLAPPFYDQDMANGPTCSAANQDIECRCSECFIWDPAGDPDWYDVHRVDQDGTVHTVIGSTPVHHTWTDEDGNVYQKWTPNWYCFAMDASTPMEGRRYIYTVRSCSAAWTPTCSSWSTESVSYIGAPIACYDQSQGGQIPCPKDDDGS